MRINQLGSPQGTYLVGYLILVRLVLYTRYFGCRKMSDLPSILVLCQSTLHVHFMGNSTGCFLPIVNLQTLCRVEMIYSTRLWDWVLTSCVRD